MSRGEDKMSVAAPNGDALKAYRHLIELQKQMIELSQQHQEAKRVCANLREEITRAWSANSSARTGARQRTPWSLANFLTCLPGFGPDQTNLNSLKRKEASSC